MGPSEVVVKISSKVVVSISSGMVIVVDSGRIGLISSGLGIINASKMVFSDVS